MKKLSLFLLLLGAILPNKQAAAGISGQAATQDCLAATPASHAGQAASILVSQKAPKHEVRAVWLTTIGGRDWPHSYAQSPISARKQQQELCQILDRLQQAKINTVLLQTRVRGTMIYPSALEPWDGCLSGFPGKSPGYDALQFAIDECHKRGMELHAWVVTIPVGKWDALGCRNLRRKFPKLIRKIGADGYMNPEDSRTGNYLAQICSEITRRYDIDGIHLDYIRYPDGWPKASWKNGDTPANRRENINRIVKAIHDAVTSEKPWVKLSASPIGKYSDLPLQSSYGYNARDKVYQDAQLWIRQGWTEQLYPMQYFRGKNYYPFAADWAANRHGRAVASGLGTWFLDPRQGRWKLDDIAREMEVSRQMGMGHAHFRSQFLLENHQGIYDFELRFNPTPALVPPMKGKRDTDLRKPTHLQTSDGAIRWEGNAPYYNVYVSDQWPVDIQNPANLLLTRYPHTQLHTQLAPRLFRGWPYVAITAMDRFGNESEPLQYEPAQPIAPQRHLPKEVYLPNDGDELDLSPVIATLQRMDADYFAIGSLQDNLLRSYLHTTADGQNAPRLFIGGMADGVYWVYAHNKRTRKMVRIGSFEIDRNSVGFIH